VFDETARTNGQKLGDTSKEQRARSGGLFAPGSTRVAAGAADLTG